MRVILDTNILLSALIAKGGTTDRIYRAWLAKAFILVTCEVQIGELRECFDRPKIVPKRVSRHEAGRMINELRARALFVDRFPEVARSPDPNDDYLLALAQASRADYLVTGDKADLLALQQHRRTHIVTASAFVGLHG